MWIIKNGDDYYGTFDYEWEAEKYAGINIGNTGWTIHRLYAPENSK